jgi:hypothetical protein
VAYAFVCAALGLSLAADRNAYATPSASLFLRRCEEMHDPGSLNKAIAWSRYECRFALALAYGVRLDVVKPTAHRSLDPTAAR